ncbi:Protein CBG06782 [Caenorhabditis briggsae]|uniref:Protein CBG06782 n=1 Tax=Caenorhabditis briggsae TaxID=6238 RepID=A8X324_CAEBR|nr:Protein CBG06782 [Caenorhabditis briggsae]CAP27034.2 Protein CBG06782 [Caenorhabditis briggsae]
MGGFLSHLEPEQNHEVLNASCGPIRGNIYKHGEKIVDGYLGIPYAKPPVRFEKPVAAEKWTEPLDCYTYGPGCPQSGNYAVMCHDWMTFDEEKCLNLNVFAPRWKSDEFPNGLPVLVYIHGGGFEIGYSGYLNDRSLSGTIPLRDVVVVTINYRVGALGFFTTGDDVAKGNYGLWDQTLALQWIQDHIGSFGGDRNNVTISGGSAGAISVDMLALSPHSNKLFKRFYSLSGTSYCTIAVRSSEDETHACEVFAKHHGYSGNETKSLLKWYQSQDVSIFRKTAEIELDFSGFLFFVPNFDGDFFPKAFEELRKEAPNLDAMVTVGEYEGLGMMTGNPKCTGSNDPLTNLKSIIADSYRSEVCNNHQEVQKKLLDAYTENVNTTDQSAVARKLVEFLSDYMFNKASLQTAKSCTTNGNNVYLASFDYLNTEGDIDPQSAALPFRASTHGSDHPYVFGDAIMTPFNPTEEQLKVMDMMGQFVANFVKYGIDVLGTLAGNKVPDKNTQVLNAPCGPIRGNIYTFLTATKTCPFLEDNCLTLNVFAPRWNLTEFPKGLPVLVYIYGGGFEIGYTSYMDGYAITGTIPQRDIILVTMNYRLGPMGFLTIADGVSNGNYALWDQTLALQWVQDNIAAFGGDPAMVTLAGTSAGSASTDFLSLSPHSNKLFRRSIQMSGTAFCNFAIRPQRVEASVGLQYAQSKGYAGNDSQSLFAWYHAQDPSNFKGGFRSKEAGVVPFVPNFDGDFFPKPFDILRKEAPKKEAMITVAEMESVGMIVFNKLFAEPYSNFGQFVDETYGLDVTDYYEDVKKNLTNFYLGNVSPLDRNATNKQVCDYVSDSVFNSGTLDSVRSYAKYGNKVYFGSFNYFNKVSTDMADVLQPFKVASHSSDFKYYFGSGVMTDFKPNTEEKKVMTSVEDLMANFVKFGDPNGKNKTKTWKPYNLSQPLKYYKISYPTSGMADNFQNGRLSLYDDINKNSKKYQEIVYGFPKLSKKAIHLKNQKSSNLAFKLMNIINFFQASESLTHLVTGFALIFPVLHSKFNFFVNVMGSLLNGFWIGDFPITVLLGICRILVFTNVIELKKMPLFVKIALSTIFSWSIFLTIYGSYTQYFIFVTPGWDYDYNLSVITFFDTQEIIISFTSLLLSYICYIFTAYLIYTKKNLSSSVQSRKDEILILVQSTLVTGYISILILIWHQTFFPFMSFIDMTKTKIQAAMNFCILLHCYVNPISTFFCNKSIREECLRILGIRKVVQKKSISVSGISTRRLTVSTVSAIA